jgi:hypothetical protein
MSSEIGNEAHIPNPALEPIKGLVGEWRTTGTHPLMPGTIFHGRTSFEWFSGGAFLLMRSEIDEPGIPSGLAILGSDGEAGTIFMLYFDERGVSRKYDVRIKDNVIEWQLENPHFSQRMTINVDPGGERLTTKGAMSREGAPWEDDLSLTCERVKP